MDPYPGSRKTSRVHFINCNDAAAGRQVFDIHEARSAVGRLYLPEKGCKMLQRVQQRRKANGESGFTLLELLIVIVILGILAAIVVFAVSGVSDKGQTSACQTDRQSISTAEESFFAAQKPAGSYTDVPGLVAGGFLHQASTLHSAAASTGVTPPTYTITGIGSCVGQ